MALYQATIDDKPYIMALYTEAIGSEGCTWNEDYPSEETMDSDLARGDAYVWKDETGELLGAISIDDDHVVEELPCWSAQLQPAAEFARLVVREDARGQASARKMILAMMQVAAKRGCKSVHYLVSPGNQRAVHSYAHLHFTLCGEADLFGEHWLCYEKQLLLSL